MKVIKSLLILFLSFWLNTILIAQTNSVVGKPKTLGGILVAQFDFQVSMNFEMAESMCEKLGSGWRLPTMDELNLLYKNKEKLGGFSKHKDAFYWSSDYDRRYQGALNKNFNDGKIRFVDTKISKIGVRAVRNVNLVSKQDLIFGKPIIFGDIMIAQNNFPKQMNWHEALLECQSLGEGWRLPSREELINLIDNKVIKAENKNKIQTFWSNDESSINEAYWVGDYRGDSEKSAFLYVRPVKDVTNMSSKYNSTQIIGKPVTISEIPNLYFAEYDFPSKMNWADAKKACQALGSNWRLPAYEVLVKLSKNKGKVENLRDDFYWSSYEFNSQSTFSVNVKTGRKNEDNGNNKLDSFYVRAVQVF